MTSTCTVRSVRTGSEPGPVVLRGGSALDQLAASPVRATCGSVALIADGAVVASGYAERVRAALDRHVETFVQVAPPGEPTVSSVDACWAALEHLDAPLVVGLGGGSALDTAKQVAVLLADPSKDGIGRYLLAREALPGRRPLVAIPTTSGTGAEVTRTCVLADDRPGGAGRKVWTWGDALLPDLVVLDPAATATMPAIVTTATGLDAFVHAIEAVTGQRRDERPAEPALRALELVSHNLGGAVGDGSDLQVRAAMQEAAYLAGTAIDGCGTGMAHAIGHALGSLYHVPHGVAVAIGLEAALPWNLDGARAAFGPVATALDVDLDGLAACYRSLWTRSRLGAAVAAVPEVGLEASAIAATLVTEENMPMVRNNCRPSTDDDRWELATRTVAVWSEMRTAP
jgi:alcohol dehydrogenase class IV